jgi:hypothetical protein
MATIRTLTTVGAAVFVGLTASLAPASARDDCTFIFCLPPKAETQADEQAKAPISITPDAKQARKSVRKVRSRKSATTKQRVRGAAAAHRKRPATRASQTTKQRRAAPSHSAQTDGGTVMRGRDTVSLIAMLPWWRNDRMQTIRYETDPTDSKVRAAADAWLVQHGVTGAEPVSDGSLSAHAQATPVDITDAGEVNEIDLAASPTSPPERTFIQSLIAVLGGAFAAASAARFLFV